VESYAPGSAGNWAGYAAHTESVFALHCWDCDARRTVVTSTGDVVLTRACPMGSLDELRRRFTELERERAPVVAPYLPAPA
jgi:hypothetical protein